MLHVIQQASNSEALSEQVSHKMTLFGVQKNTIESTIGIGAEGVNMQIEELKKYKKEENLKQEDKERIQKQIQSLEENRESQELGILGQARKRKHDIEVEDMEIEQSLPQDEDITFYREEIEEYKNNGFRGSFKIKEIKPIDWKAVIAVAALGLAQLVAGAALTVFTLGAGASIGMGLITEGVSDLITAVKDGIINRDFSWVSYGIQKAISLTVSLVCAGLGAIKDAAKTAVAGVKSIGQAMTTTVKAGWKIAAKAIGTGLAKGVAKELVTQLVNYGVSKTIMPAIQDEVMQRIEQPIQNALLANNRVKEMLKLDGINRNNHYERLIKDRAMELLNSQEQQNGLLSITVGIAKGIATQKIAGLSAILTTYEVTQALAELDTFVPNFIKKLNEVIDKIYEEEKIDEKHSGNQQDTVVTQTTDDRKENKNEKTSQNYTASYIPETSSTDIDTNNDVEPQEQVQLERKSKSSDVLCGTLATSVSAKMCNIIQKKLITPVTQTGISYGMTKLTSDLDKSLQDEIGIYQAERRTEFFQDQDKNNRIGEEYKKGMEDETAVAKADEMIDQLKNGGEAGLPHLGPLSDVAGRPIKVLDEKGQVIRIIGEDKGGEPIEVQYHKPNENNPSGHWTLPGGQEPKFGDTGKNNCLFNVVAQATGNDPNQLRQYTAARMESDKGNLANQAHDIRRLEQDKRDALTMGGCAVYTKGNAKETIDKSQGRRPFGSKAPGHPRDHVENSNNVDITRKREHSTYIDSTDQNRVLEDTMSRYGDPNIGEYNSDNHPILSELTPDVNKVVVTAPVNTNESITMNSYERGVPSALDVPVTGNTLVLHNQRDKDGNCDMNAPLHTQTVFPVNNPNINESTMKIHYMDPERPSVTIPLKPWNSMQNPSPPPPQV